MRRDEFESLALAELDTMYRFARFLTREAGAAEELVQDVYARAFRTESISRFRERGAAMRAWLMTIARSIFYGRLEHDGANRRAMERLGRIVAEEHAAMEAPQPAHVAGIDWAKAGPLVDAALDALSIELREVLWLWAVEGLKYREIAAAMDIPVGTVMSRLHRARTAAAYFLLADDRSPALRAAGVVHLPPKGAAAKGRV